MGDVSCAHVCNAISVCYVNITLSTVIQSGTLRHTSIHGLLPHMITLQIMCMVTYPYMELFLYMITHDKMFECYHIW